MKQEHNHIEVVNGAPIKSWAIGVQFEDAAKAQVENIARLPFIYNHVAIMPDVHMGIGATIGSVIATKGAIIPAAIGVDIGCGMNAVKTNLTASDLPESLKEMRERIETKVPHGQVRGGGWNDIPTDVENAWLGKGFKMSPSNSLGLRYLSVIAKNPKVAKKDGAQKQLCSLGGGNHFIEVCLDQEDNVWIMLHSGSRGVGNEIGKYFIELAKQDMKTWHINLPDKDLAYLAEGTSHFDEYWEAMNWAQDFAAMNRELMVERVRTAMENVLKREVSFLTEVFSCHHNYATLENHFGENVYVTRKGAIRARVGDCGIIPGSMGSKSYIVMGKGDETSFCSAPHGAGRMMSRTQARNTFTLEDHERDTSGVECKKDKSVLDETPKAYKPIEKVIEAALPLVEVVNELKQILCVKG